MARCGLFAASTYRKPLPNAVLTDYLSYCHNSGFVQFEPGKALDLAKRVVAAVPDFSWGWSAVAIAAGLNTFDNPTGPRFVAFREQAGEAADKAIELDKTNSEALMVKAFLVDRSDFVGQEKLFRAALAARPLACGCEHHSYGTMLLSVGRIADATDEYRRSTDVLSLDSDSQLALAEALLMQGKTDEAKSHFDSGIDLSSAPDVKENIEVLKAAITGDYAAAAKAAQSPKLTGPGPTKTAIQIGFQAMVSGDPASKAKAVQILTALPLDMKRRRAATLLGALGANREALELVGKNMELGRSEASSWLFIPSMAGAIRDPTFPEFARKHGLMTYWKTTHTRPDLCSAQDAPSFCQMI
jgi:tetratricopeptide (TPR) repeat protein